MPYIDPIVMGLLALGLLGWLVHTWRSGVRGGRFVAAFFAAFFGHTLVVMMGAHQADIVYALLVAGKSPVTGAAARFDWRTYSLLLFGAFLMWQGVRCLRGAARLRRGELAARTEVLRAAGLVLLVVFPLVWVHAFFGYVISGATTLTLAAVAVGARERAPTDRERTRALTPSVA